MKDPLFDLRAQLSQIIGQTQNLLKHQTGNHSSISTTWLPLCHSLSIKQPAKTGFKHSTSQAQGRELEKRSSAQQAPAFHETKQSSSIPAPALLSPVAKNPLNSTFSIKATPSVDLENSQNEVSKAGSAPTSSQTLEARPSRKVGRFVLQPPTTTPTDTSEIAHWLSKKGLHGSQAQKPSSNPRVSSNKKIALSPVVILHTSTTSSLESFGRLKVAIEDKFMPCQLLPEDPLHIAALIEALERGRLECLIYEDTCQRSQEWAHFQETLRVGHVDLNEKSRKLELWKNIVQRLGKTT